MLMLQLQAEYAKLTDAERASIKRCDMEWVASMFGWVRDALPPEHRAELDAHRAVLAVLSFYCWRRPHGLRLIRGGKK